MEKQQKDTGNYARAVGSGRSTWKQEGHMVMEASGRSERKYCHCRGGGQRLMRTSRRLMARSTDRLTTTGTNSEPPCCRWGEQEAGAPVTSLRHGGTFMWVMIDRELFEGRHCVGFISVSPAPSPGPGAWEVFGKCWGRKKRGREEGQEGVMEGRGGESGCLPPQHSQLSLRPPSAVVTQPGEAKPERGGGGRGGC